ncbi:MAG TPA: hypothetical protein VGN48_03115 [Pedococcus sp.]|nr:hypothetical protein [Pedococcus sp.]
MTVHSWPPLPGRRPPAARPAPYPPKRHPRARLHPRRRPNLTTAACDEMLVDEIASRVTGDMVNAGIASIDARWSAGQSLENTLGTYTRLAHQASRQYTAGLWTLIAWIHWRRRNMRAAWPALNSALAIDPNLDAPHYLAVFMHHEADPAHVPLVRFR